MENNLKRKTIKGLYHSFIGVFANNGIGFFVSVILARLLTPNDYGLLGMVMIFTTISNIFIDGGLTTALIREKNVTNSDYSTVFYYNLIVSIFAYIIIFILAKPISIFFREPKLLLLTRTVGINLIIGALGNIQRVKLSRSLNFKVQTKIDLVSAVLSSFVGILLAYSGYGVWSLVAMQLSAQIIINFLLIYHNKWKPQFVFDKNRFREFFDFGSKMLITGLLATVYNNIYNMIFGRSYSSEILGYYTKSKSTKDMVSNSIVGTVSKVGYPVLSSIQEDKSKFQNSFIKIIKHVDYLSFPVFVGLISTSDVVISTVFGNTWIPMIPYFRVLCLAAIIFPHNALNLNILQVVGRSDLFLKIDIINMIIGLVLILLSSALGFGVEGLFGVIIITTIISFISNAYYSKKFIDYGILQQTVDLLPALFVSLAMGVSVYIVSLLIPFSGGIAIVFLITLGVSLYILLSIIFKISEFRSISLILKNFIGNKKGDLK